MLNKTIYYNKIQYPLFFMATLKKSFLTGRKQQLSSTSKVSVEAVGFQQERQ